MFEISLHTIFSPLQAPCHACAGVLIGSFNSVAINGLMPGFEYDLKIVNRQVVLEALNDGVPQRMIFLPLVRQSG